MRIVSYNIWFSEIQRENRLISLVATIISQTPEPDILCFQEVIPETLKILKQLLEDKYHYIVPETLSSTYGVATFSKHKIIEHITVPFVSRMGRDLLIAKIEYGNKKKILVANAHFESEFSNTNPNKLKLNQYKTAEETLNLLHDPENITVICADTNIVATEEDKYFSSWKDCWTERKSSETEKNTYDSGTNPYLARFREKYYARLDRINVKGECEIESFVLLRGIDGMIVPSDHYGVMIDVR